MNYDDLEILAIDIDNARKKNVMSTFSTGHQTDQLKHFVNI